MQGFLNSLQRDSAQRNALAALSVYRLGAVMFRASAVWILRFYKRWVSPMLPSACRFHPTCSEYMIGAIEKHGLWRGAGMGVWRLLRCHPFHQGGFDPVR